MESISPKERFYPCPHCSFSISSNLPKCKRCGLEVSADGVDELARTEAAKIAAITDAKHLKGISFLFALLSMGANYVLTGNSIFVLFLLESWMFGLCAFIWKLGRWHQNHSQSYFELDILEEAKKEKKKAIIIFLFSLGFVAFNVFRNL